MEKNPFFLVASFKGHLTQAATLRLQQLSLRTEELISN